MPRHEITPSADPIEIPKGDEELPAEVQYLKELMSWDEYLDATYTNAFLIIRNGVLTHEWYREGFTAEQRLPSYSVAKTMTSIMIGQLVEAGKIKESDYFVDYFPEYKNGSLFDRARRTSCDYYQGTNLDRLLHTPGRSQPPNLVGRLDSYRKHQLHFAYQVVISLLLGLNAEYRSVDTQMLGMIIKKVTGKRVADYFSENVWHKVGAEFPATWNVDRVYGTEKTFCCFNAAARDYARVGMAILNGGFAGFTRVISRDWLERMKTPVVTLDRGWGYGAQVWHPYPETAMALGLDGQFIFIDPESRTLIFKLSDNPPGSDTEEPTAEVLYTLAKTKR